MRRVTCVFLMIMLVLTGMAAAEEDSIKESTYQRAIQLFEAGEYDTAIAIFELLGDYSDSVIQIALCRTAKSQSYYDRATELFEAGEYDAAKEVYQMLGDFKDSAIQMIRCETQKKQVQYDKADKLADEGQYERAKEIFLQLGDYSDSLARAKMIDESILEAQYNTAVGLQETGFYEEALAAFEAVIDYKDASERINECQNQIYASNLDNQIDEALRNTEFDAKHVYTLIKEARDYGFEETMIDDWYAVAYDLETVADYGDEAVWLDHDLDNTGKYKRIISAGEKLMITEMTADGIEVIASVPAPSYKALSIAQDLSGRSYIEGVAYNQSDVYLFDTYPALITSIPDTQSVSLNWTNTGFELHEQLTQVPYRDRITEYVVFSGTVFYAINPQVTVNMDGYPKVDSGIKLINYYQEALVYQSDVELSKLVFGANDPSAITKINEWLDGRTIDSADIAVWNADSDNFTCVVRSGEDRLNILVVRTTDGEFQLLGLL